MRGLLQMPGQCSRVSTGGRRLRRRLRIKVQLPSRMRETRASRDKKNDCSFAAWTSSSSEPSGSLSSQTAPRWLRAPARGFRAADADPDLDCERLGGVPSPATAAALLVLRLVDDELREAGHGEREMTVLVRVNEALVEEALASDGEGASRGAERLGKC